MKTTINTNVDWNAYAQKYDMLLSYNPYYQALHKEVLIQLEGWKIDEEGIIADLGAGTGNYSSEMARIFPKAQILHIDNNTGMNEMAKEKAKGMTNFQVLEKTIEQVSFDNESLQGLICINAIYTFPNPEKVLRRMYNWLAPGASAVIVDPGRIMSIFSWKIAIAKHLIKTYGFRKAIEIFKESKAVGNQNTFIREQQINGTYWTHTHAGFCDTVRQAGFHIESSSVCYKGDCDMVIVRKK